MPEVTLYNVDVISHTTVSMYRTFIKEKDADMYISFVNKIFPGSTVHKTCRQCARKSESIERMELTDWSTEIRERLFQDVIRKHSRKLVLVEKAIGLTISKDATRAFDARVARVAEVIRNRGASRYGQCVRTGAAYNNFSTYFKDDCSRLFEDIGYVDNILHNGEIRRARGSREVTLRDKLVMIGKEIFNGLYDDIATMYFPPSEYKLPRGSKLNGDSRVELLEDSKIKMGNDTFSYQSFMITNQWVMLVVYKSEVEKCRMVFNVTTGKKLDSSRVGRYRLLALEIPFKKIPKGTVFMCETWNRLTKYVFGKKGLVDEITVSSTDSGEFRGLYYFIEEEGDKHVIFIGEDGDNGVYDLEVVKNGPKGVPTLVPTGIGMTWIPPAPLLP